MIYFTSLVLCPLHFTHYLLCCTSASRVASGRSNASLFVHALKRVSMQTISVDSPSFFEGEDLCLANALECMLLWALRLAYALTDVMCMTCFCVTPHARTVTRCRYGADALNEFPESMSSLRVQKLKCEGLVCFV